MAKLAIILLVISVYLGYKIKTSLIDPPPLPPKLKEVWWGPGKPGSVKPVAKPFVINVSDEILEDLKWRLDKHRTLTPPLEGIQHQYGMNTNILKQFVEYWRTKYNWRNREKFLNQFPQYTINIQGLDIHYIHLKPKVSQHVRVLPLLLLHGWPGSVREFYDIIPLLTTPQDGRRFVFEVIVPHIPGYGFSKPAVRPGMGPDAVALIFKNLMNQLGHEKFYTQGGDFGSIILQNMAVLYPESVLGFHSNFCTAVSPLATIKTMLASFFPSFPSWYVRPDHYNKLFPMIDYYLRMIRETGYLHEQSTKPDTVGVGINDSPVALAAYILEKFIAGTNYTWTEREDNVVLEAYSYDDLIDNLMFYWVTNSATTSFRLYSETFVRDHWSKGTLSIPITVPSACARFSQDITSPDGMIKDVHPNLVQLTDYEGGHFAAMQLPKVLAQDVYNAVELFEKLNVKDR